MEPTLQEEQKVQVSQEIPQQGSTPTPEVTSQSTSFSFKKKIAIGIGVLLCVIVLIFVVLALLGSTVGKDGGAVKETVKENSSTNTTNTETKTITVQELFPEISGNIADYDLTIPKEYTTQYISVNDRDLSTSVLANNSLIGVKEDIDNVVSQVRENNKVDFKIISHGIFRARFTATTGLDDNGDFVDQKSGPISASLYEGIGVTNISFKKDFFRGIKGVPIAIITGELQGSHLRMLYLYSPVDNLVVLFSLQGGSDQAENDIIWNTFAESFTKPL
jgi:hypothetical protein